MPGLRAAGADRRRPARRGPPRLPAVGRPRGGGADLRARDGRSSRSSCAGSRPRRSASPGSSTPTSCPLLDYWREPNRAVMVSRLMTGGHLGQRIPSGGFDTADALAVFETVAVGRRVGPPPRRGARTDPTGERAVRRRGQRLRRRPRRRRDLHRDHHASRPSAYDAPERLGGVLATPAADVYSLGVLVHHLLGGSPPPQDGPLPLGDGAVDVVVARATDPDPRRRQQSVDELAAELRDALAVPGRPDGGVRTDPQPLPRPRRVRAGRRRGLPRSGTRRRPRWSRSSSASGCSSSSARRASASRRS